MKENSRMTCKVNQCINIQLNMTAQWMVSIQLVPSSFLTSHDASTNRYFSPHHN